MATVGFTVSIQHWFDRTAIWMATAAYSGYFGMLPGTIGSLVGIGLYWPLATSPVTTRLILVAALLLVGLWTSGRVEEVWRIKDPKAVVIDEIVGMWIALLFVPYQLPYFVASFVLFRLFDVVKPFPAKEAERLSGGWGIMLDDVIAGLYAGVTVSAVNLLEVLL
jgi:phosphatidylglycerophosphatase A